MYLRLFILMLLLPCASFAQMWDLTVMTFNIRYDNPQDGDYSWENRKPMVADMLHDQKPDIIGFQEVLKSQVADLAQMLKPYKWAGVGRDDGKDAGEFAPVFYDPLRFDLRKSGTFWLSETPEIPGSRSWNSACTRIVTWVELKDGESGKILFVFNTHFDHMSVEARNESARLLISAIDQLAGKHWVIVTGDFNDTRCSEMYHLLTSTPPENALFNTQRISKSEPSGPDYTFVGFPFNPEPGNTIDFIFSRGGKGVVVKDHWVITYHVEDQYPSDHLPVQATFEISKIRK